MLWYCCVIVVIVLLLLCTVVLSSVSPSCCAPHVALALLLLLSTPGLCVCLVYVFVCSAPFHFADGPAWNCTFSFVVFCCFFGEYVCCFLFPVSMLFRCCFDVVYLFTSLYLLLWLVFV